jgi:hypothetical protein
MVAFTALTGDSRPARAAHIISVHALEEELRHRLGLSYSVAGGGEMFGPDHQYAWVGADCLPDATERVRDVFVGTMERLGREGPTETNSAG